METFSPFLLSFLSFFTFFVVAWQFEADCLCLLLIIFNYLSSTDSATFSSMFLKRYVSFSIFLMYKSCFILLLLLLLLLLINGRVHAPKIVPGPAVVSIAVGFPPQLGPR